MTNEDYMARIARLREIESQVKNPEFSLDRIDALIDETRKIVSDCYAYTRTLRDKVDSLDDIRK